MIADIVHCCQGLRSQYDFANDLNKTWVEFVDRRDGDRQAQARPYKRIHMPRKTHHSAVAVVPPADVWEPIQTIRRRHDRHFQRWMPHVNLLYPFVPHAQFAEVFPVLSAASESVAAFSITLAEFRFFRHPSGSSTVWLMPEPDAALGHLQATLQAALPICNDLSQFAGGFTPHLSVGQARSASDRQALIEACQAHWRPLTFCLEAIALIWREADSPFQVAHWCPLRQV